MVEISARPSARSPVRAVTVTHEVIGGPRVGDELLAAVDDPLAVDQVCPRLRRPGVRPGSGLGEAEAGERRAGDQVGQPGLLLLVGAIGQDRVDSQPDRRLQRDRHRLVDAADLLDRDAQAGEVTVLARPAVLLRRRQAEQAELAHLLHDVDREVVCLVPVGCVRGDLRLGEVSDAVAEVLVLPGQFEAHPESFGSHPRPCRRTAVCPPYSVAAGSRCSAALGLAALDAQLVALDVVQHDETGAVRVAEVRADRRAETDEARRPPRPGCRRSA